METLPETFIHPAGYCQNVLSTGVCQVTGQEVVRGRETIGLTCLHPRTTEMTADRPDFTIRIAVDRDTGIIVRLTESMAGEVTRDAEVVDLEPDPALQPTTFDFVFPTGTTMLYRRRGPSARSRTRSITWITPFDTSMSAAITWASLM